MKEKMILLIEDNQDDIDLTLRAFKKNNIKNRIEVFKDGEEALNFLLGQGKYAGRDISDTPALILLDLKLPKLDGHQVLQKIRKNKPTRFLPVVILTSSKEEGDLLKGYSAGCNSYVQKPVDFNDFMKAVQNMGLYWLLLNEVPDNIQGS